VSAEKPPERLRLERDLEAEDFEAGIAAGLWRIENYEWPILDVALTAGDGHELGMRLEVDDYPRLAPGGQLWDHADDSPLQQDRWPVGACAPQVFKEGWAPQGRMAPYMACDRHTLASKPEWSSQYPDRAWNPSRSITFYLSEVSFELREAELPQSEAVETP
jgi:hypothetical protein